MASYTPNLDLLKKDPITDAADTFNIKTMMNDNWDKIDDGFGSLQTEVTEHLAEVTSQGILKPAPLISTDNLNDIKKQGVYRYTSGGAPLNSPISTAFYLEVIGLEHYPVQRVSKIYSNDVFIRALENESTGVWTSWVKFTTKTELDGHINNNVSSGVHGMGRIASQDYEEGTFTPVIAGLTTSGSHTYNIQVGNYKRIGNTVTFLIEIRMSVKDVNMAGYVVVKGLPFIAARNTSVSLGRVDSVSFTNGLMGYVFNGNSYIALSEVLSNSNDSRLDSTKTSNNTLFYISGTYQI